MTALPAPASFGAGGYPHGKPQERQLRRRNPATGSRSAPCGAFGAEGRGTPAHARGRGQDPGDPGPPAERAQEALMAGPRPTRARPNTAASRSSPRSQSELITAGSAPSPDPRN